VESKVYTLPEETEKPKVRKTRTVSTQHLKESPIIATPVVTAPPVVEKVKQTRRKSSDVQAEKDAVTAALKGDDFRIIEGMGLRITQLFHENGVKTFNQLASLDYDAMKGFLRANGFKLANPTTWGDQAKLAAEGKMDELEIFKKSLSRGLRVQ
jgi:predicted flap endonuclease-1-like 5' DNA nuclease